MLGPIEDDGFLSRLKGENNSLRLFKDSLLVDDVLVGVRNELLDPIDNDVFAS